MWDLLCPSPLLVWTLSSAVRLELDWWSRQRREPKTRVPTSAILSWLVRGLRKRRLWFWTASSSLVQRCVVTLSECVHEKDVVLVEFESSWGIVCISRTRPSRLQKDQGCLLVAKPCNQHKEVYILSNYCDIVVLLGLWNCSLIEKVSIFLCLFISRNRSMLQSCKCLFRSSIKQLVFFIAQTFFLSVWVHRV